MRGSYVVRLTAADVGRRVTVRRLLAPEEPRAGRATTTDVVGVLRAWAHGVLEVERDDGERVRIAEADVVAARARPDPGSELR